MGYARLDDSFWANPKVTAVTAEAFRLYVRAISHSSAYNTGGAVSEATAAALQGTRKALAELVSAGLFEAENEGWIIHDFARHQVSQAKRSAGRANARARWEDAPTAAATATDDGFASCENGNGGISETADGGIRETDQRFGMMPNPEFRMMPEQPHLPEVGPRGAEDDYPRRRVWELAGQVLGRDLRPAEHEILADRCEGTDPEWVALALVIARSKGATRLNYAWAILDDWGAAGPPLRVLESTSIYDGDDSAAARHARYGLPAWAEAANQKRGTA